MLLDRCCRLGGQAWRQVNRGADATRCPQTATTPLLLSLAFHTRLMHLVQAHRICLLRLFILCGCLFYRFGCPFLPSSACGCSGCLWRHRTCFRAAFSADGRRSGVRCRRFMPWTLPLSTCSSKRLTRGPSATGGLARHRPGWRRGHQTKNDGHRWLRCCALLRRAHLYVPAVSATGISPLAAVSSNCRVSRRAPTLRSGLFHYPPLTRGSAAAPRRCGRRRRRGCVTALLRAVRSPCCWRTSFRRPLLCGHRWTLWFDLRNAQRWLPSACMR